jgi:hypothetical protein
MISALFSSAFCVCPPTEEYDGRPSVSYPSTTAVSEAYEERLDVTIPIVDNKLGLKIVDFSPGQSYIILPYFSTILIYHSILMLTANIVATLICFHFILILMVYHSNILITFIPR